MKRGARCATIGGQGERLELHSIVILSLHSPKEKIWGELLVVSTAGVTMRGIDLNSFDHFIRQLNEPDGERVGVPTLFFPMTRVERSVCLICCTIPSTWPDAS